MGAVLSNPTLHYSRGANPRRNLPAKSARKRGESNFLRAFERAYLSSLSASGVARADFDFSGYGIADLVWISWQSPVSPDDMTAIGLTQRPKVRVMAFELKLNDWRKGLQQAFRYSYFANCSVVVLPPAVARRAKQHLPDFRHLQVGLWSFEPKTGKVVRLFMPRHRRPRSTSAQHKAIASLLSLSKLR
jgi:hypothetical protein